jgi:trigger factor
VIFREDQRENTLNIEQQVLENHQVKLIVSVESSKLEEAKHQAARHISQHKKIAGFRPGKAPYTIVLHNFGEEAILEEALDKTQERVAVLPGHRSVLPPAC